MKKTNNPEVTSEDIRHVAENKYVEKDPVGLPCNRKERRDKQFGRGRWKK